MGEKDNPFVADELMKIYVPIRRFSLKVGRFATQTQAVKGQHPFVNSPCPNQMGRGCLRLWTFLMTHIAGF